MKTVSCWLNIFLTSYNSLWQQTCYHEPKSPPDSSTMCRPCWMVICSPCAQGFCWVADLWIRERAIKVPPRRLSSSTTAHLLFPSFCSLDLRDKHWAGTMSQKVVLITGCSSGIGLALAVRIAKDEKKRFMGKCAIFWKKSFVYILPIVTTVILDLFSDFKISRSWFKHRVDAAFRASYSIGAIISNVKCGYWPFICYFWYITTFWNIYAPLYEVFIISYTNSTQTYLRY